VYQVEPVSPQPQPEWVTTTNAESFFVLDAADMKALEKTAIKWGVDALKTFRGETLERALDISRAIVDFVAEIESC